MKKVFPLVTALIFLSSFSFAQQSEDSITHADEEAERYSDNLKQFISGLVDNLQQYYSEMVEDQRRNSSTRVEMHDIDDEDSSSSEHAVTFTGDAEVAKGDTIQGDIIVKSGTLIVYGVVTGDAVVFNGIIKLRNGARIFGNARAINGEVLKDEDAIVDGYIEETDGKPSRSKKTLRTKYSYSFTPNAFWLRDEMLDELTLFRYNRVEGFFLGVGAEKKYYWDGSRSLSGWGSVGYGFAMHKWRMQLGLDRQFSTENALYEIGSEIHSLTDSKDDWIMKTSENTTTAFFSGEDYRDYFQREGFSLHTARFTRDTYFTMFDLRYSYDRYNSLSKNTDWSLFGGSNIFRQNPKINEGIVRSVKVSAGLSSVEKYRHVSEGWNIFANVEYAGNQFGGNYNFTTTMLDFRRFQPLSSDDELSARLRIGSLSGDLVGQRVYEIGGANTLPAYGFKSLAGNRMVLLNLEYENTDIFDELFFWSSSSSLILFADAGGTAFVPPSKEVYEGFDAVKPSRIKSDVGFGIGMFGDDMRLGFAWRTDVASPVSVFLRFNKAF